MAKKYLKTLILYLFVIISSFAQVGIGTTNPDTSAALDIVNPTGGLLIPRVALTATTDTATINGIEAESLLVYNTAVVNDVTTGFYFWNGTYWERLLSETNENENWRITGNTGTNSGTHFLGTQDNEALDVRTNNVLRTRFTTKGQIAIYNTGASVFIGENAGNSDDLNNRRNHFIGQNAGQLNTTGNNNIALGYNALSNNLTSSNNIAIGNRSGLFNTSGSNNVSVGTDVLLLNTTGENNVSIGYNANKNNSSGSRNVTVGYSAGPNLGFATGSRNIYLGSFAGFSNTSRSDRLYIDNTPTSAPLIGGDFSINAVAINKLDSAPLEHTLTVGGSVKIEDLLNLEPREEPSSPDEGDIYYDSDLKKVRVWTGSAWENLH